MPGLLFKPKPTPVQHHPQLWESTTTEINELTSPPPIPGLFHLFQRSCFLPALWQRDSTARSIGFPLLFKLILSFDRALLSSHKYRPGMLLLQGTLASFVLSTSSVQVHMYTSESISLDRQEQSLSLLTWQPKTIYSSNLENTRST